MKKIILPHILAKLASYSIKKKHRTDFLLKYDINKIKEKREILEKGFDSEYYRNRYVDVHRSKIDPIEHYMKFGRNEGRFISQEEENFANLREQSSHLKKASEIFYESIGHNIRKLNFINVVDKGEKDEEITLNVITDSLDKNSLFGGVGTALALALFFCSKTNARLRIITRDVPANIRNLISVSKYYGCDISKTNISFHYDDGINKENKLVIDSKDVFLTTSWWTSKALRDTLPTKRFFYILQEVESFFYPYGTNHYFVSEVNNDGNIDFIINSHSLFEYLSTRNIVKGDKIYFNPSVSKELKPRALKSNNINRKYTLFFYARPNNPRNLYLLGLKYLDKAVRTGMINPEKWDIYFAGSSEIGNVILGDKITPVNKGILSLKEYTDFLSNTDLAITLMYTPHPSYPPLEALASGSVVLTNVFENKKSFPQSKNALFTELSEEEFLLNLSKAINLAQNLDIRRQNYYAQDFSVDWYKAFEKTIVFMEEKVNE